MNIAEFLLARIEEDFWSAAESECRCAEKPDRVHPLPSCPVRVQEDCEAKGKIVQNAQRWDADLATSSMTGTTAVLHDVLRNLAAAYKTHPDFRDEW